MRSDWNGSFCDTSPASKNTFWSIRIQPSPRLPSVTVRFQKKVDLSNLVVYNGDAANYDKSDRLAELTLNFHNNQSAVIPLKDTPDKQTVNVPNGKGVQEVTITLSNFYKSKGAKYITLTEIEFFTKPD